MGDRVLALSGTAHSPKISGTCPVPVPVPVPDNCQTACDDRLRAGPLCESRPAPRVSAGMGGANLEISRLDSARKNQRLVYLIRIIPGLPLSLIKKRVPLLFLD